MPYKLKKVKNGYYVENMNTKKRYSKKPMALSDAKLQIRILRAIELKEKR